MAIDEVHGAIGQSSPGKCRNGFDYFPKFRFPKPQLLNTELISSPKQCDENGHAKRAEPIRLVVGRRYGKIQECASLVPHTAVVACHHTEVVHPWSQIRIERLPPRPR